MANIIQTLNHFWHKNQPSETTGNSPIPLHHFTLLRGHAYPCSRCSIESPSCFKLHFRDNTICASTEAPAVSPSRKNRIRFK